MAIYARLGIEPPKPPEFDGLIQRVIQTYIMATRARKYVEGQPMALTVRDITDVVAAHPVDLPRDLLDSIIFALDDLALGEKENKSKDR